MENREEVEGSRQMLLVNSNAGSGSSRYGSIDFNDVPASPSRPLENRDEEDDEEEEVDNSDEASVKSANAAKSGCCSAVQGRDSYHRRLLIFDVLVIFLGVITSGILFLELKLAYGQCIIGMPLYEGGLLVGRTEVITSLLMHSSM